MPVRIQALLWVLGTEQRGGQTEFLLSQSLRVPGEGKTEEGNTGGITVGQDGREEMHVG